VVACPAAVAQEVDLPPEEEKKEDAKPNVFAKKPETVKLDVPKSSGSEQSFGKKPEEDKPKQNLFANAV
jgi:hypothetical protein